jgi:hypothetical protein
MKTVKAACVLQDNALSINVSDQIEQLDELISAEGGGEALRTANAALPPPARQFATAD